MSRGRRRPARLAAPLAAVALLAGCTSTTSGSSDTRYVAGDGAITLVGASDRPAPVDLSGTTLDGETLDVATLRGEPVVVNVWGSWCGPCRKEAPELQAAATELEADGVRFVGIAVRDNVAGAKAFEAKFGVTYPSLFDTDGALLLALRGAVPPSAIPSTLVLDAQGRIAARVSGATTRKTLVDLVSDVRGADAG